MSIKKIGIIGGGQLAMMLANSAHKLGFGVNILEKSKDCSAYSVLNPNLDKFICGELDYYNSLLKLANLSDVLTFEIEHIDTNLLIKLEKESGVNILPYPSILGTINDKFVQKTYLSKFGFPVGEFESLNTISQFEKLKNKFGLPLILKTKKGGYDGGGNFVLKTQSEIDKIILDLDLNKNYDKYFVEKFVEFEREISVLLARSMSCEIACYPIIDTIQNNNVCTQTNVPSTLDIKIINQAKQIAIDLVQKTNYIGVVAVEMFVLNNGQVIINEIAPRVHNSGHWTMNGSKTSQFEQHIRCITGMTLGSVENTFPATIMYNVFGYNYNIFDNLKNKSLSGVFIYDYNKSVIRPNRKMGHINIAGNSVSDANNLLNDLKD